MKNDGRHGYVVRETDGSVVGSVHYDDSAPQVNIEGRVYVPRQWTMRSVAGELNVRLDYEMIHGAPECVGIEVTGYGLGKQALDTVRRGLPRWGQLAQRAVMAQGVKIVSAEGVGVMRPSTREVAEAEKKVRGRRREITDEMLAEVAGIYRDNPGRRHEAVAKRWSVTATTANKYIYMARKAGLIPPAPKQGRAAK